MTGLSRSVFTFARRIGLIPWHASQLFTGAKSYADNTLIGSPLLNRLGLHGARVRLAASAARRRRRRLARLIPPDDMAAFDRDGFLEKREFLPSHMFDRLRTRLLETEWPAREMAQGRAVTRRIAVDPALLDAVPEVRRLIRDPRWRGLLRYAGSHDAEPLIYVQTILTGVEGNEDPQTVLHADTFHSTVKAWLFLDAVGDDDGPFCYVPGSHRATPLRLAWERARSIAARDGADRLSARGSPRIALDELAGLGLSLPRRFAVPANTLIVADTHGFHARAPARRATIRIEIWAYARGNPFTPWPGLDIAGRLGIAERRVGWMWRVRDLLSGVIGQPWRYVGRKRPGDPVAGLSARTNLCGRPGSAPQCN